MTTPRPHARLQGTGHWISETLAARTTQALTHLTREHKICDGYLTRGEQTGRGGGPTILVKGDPDADNPADRQDERISVTSVEAIALARTHFDNQQVGIRAAANDIIEATNTLAALLTIALKTETPEVIKIIRCAANQIGMEGAIIWGNPTCLEIPVKARLCSACYQRDRRWRLTQNLDPRETEPAA